MTTNRLIAASESALAQMGEDRDRDVERETRRIVKLKKTVVDEIGEVTVEAIEVAKKFDLISNLRGKKAVEKELLKQLSESVRIDLAPLRSK